VGDTVITFTATDASGNVAEATTTLTVFDVTPTPTSTASPTPTETPTPTPTSTATQSNETETQTPTASPDYDVRPLPITDGKIDALDLLEWYGRVQDGSPTEILFDFSRFWRTGDAKDGE